MIFHAHWLLVTVQVIRAFAVVLGASLVGRVIQAMRLNHWRNWLPVGQRRAKFLVTLIGAVTISTFIAVTIAAPITLASLIQVVICAIFIYGHVYLDTVVPEHLDREAD